MPAQIAKELGRGSFVTENGAVFNDEQLRQFSLVVLNSASGDFLTSGDNSHDAPWYADTIIGTRFIGHPGGEDHIQSARISFAQPDRPVMAGVALPWSPRDEWYSFSASPADKGMEVLARIDEERTITRDRDCRKSGAA